MQITINGFTFLYLECNKALHQNSWTIMNSLDMKRKHPQKTGRDPMHIFINISVWQKWLEKIFSNAKLFSQIHHRTTTFHWKIWDCPISLLKRQRVGDHWSNLKFWVMSSVPHWMWSVPWALCSAAALTICKLKWPWSV